MNAFTEGLITIGLAIVGLAVVSVLVSRNAQTAGVIQASASGFGNDLLAATAPVTGASLGGSLAYPGSNYNGLSPNTLGMGFGS